MSAKTLYFAFGSNLLASRMHVNNPTAVRAGIGKLQDYQLDFISFCQIWQGHTATIVPKKDSHLWGALWEIPTEDLVHLDKQEGVHVNLYRPISIDVITPEGKVLKARSYEQVQGTEKVTLDNQPNSRKPTPAYLKTIIQGALESGLPADYIDYLRNIPDNGSTVQPNLKYVYTKE